MKCSSAECRCKKNFILSILHCNERALRPTDRNFDHIDNYAKDGGPGRSDFCVVFTMNLYALELK